MAGVNFFSKFKVSKPACFQCPLHTGETPKEVYTGIGRKKILIINETPDTDKSELMRTLVTQGVLYDDVWVMNALQCPAHKEAHKYNKKIAQNCAPALDKAIKTLKPKKVILTGLYSQRAFYADRPEMIDSVLKHRGSAFWDSKYNTWVFPLMPYSMVASKPYDKALPVLYTRDIVSAIKYPEEPPRIPELSPKRLIVAKDALEYLKYLLKVQPLMAFDYEGTCIKPQRSFARAVSVGIATESTCVAMPLEHPHWTEEERAEVLKYWVRVLKSPKIKKIAHKLNFEMAWSAVRFGVVPRNMMWDTQLCQHVIDNRSDIYGLKFQAWRRWGIAEDAYNKQIDQYLKSDSPLVPNRVLQAPLDLLLKYNGYDALYTYWLYKEQIRELQGKEKEAYQFFHDGNVALTELHLNGIKVNVKYYTGKQTELVRRIKEIETEILSSEYALMFSKRTGHELSVSSPRDLQELFYNIMQCPVVKKTKTGQSVDEEALQGLKSPLADRILEMRKLEKIRSTYVEGFLREETAGRMHPFFGLNRVVSFRSSSSGPNWQNIPKRDKDAKRITREGIVPSEGHVLSETDFCFTGDTLVETNEGPKSILDICTSTEPVYVYCYDNVNKRIAFSKVIGSGRTQKNAELLRITLDNSAVIKCTPGHRFMLRDGSYKEARHLLPSDSLMPYCKGREYNQSVHLSTLEKCPSEDVYNITVEKHHNYALSAGVIVKNCGAEVNTSAAYHLDKNFINYQLDPSTDMHRDCYSSDTKILTEGGFKYYDEIHAYDKIAQYNEATNKIEYVLPTDRICYEYNGDMRSIQNRYVDVLVTPNHRMYLKKKGKEFGIVKAKDIKKTLYYSKTGADITEEVVPPEFYFEPVYGTGTNSTKKYHESFTVRPSDMFELLGYLVTDGHFKYHKQGAYRINLSQIKEPHRSKMKACIDRIKSYTNFPFHEKKGKWSLSNKSLCSWLCANFGVNKVNRRLPHFIKYAPIAELKLFFDACMLGNGGFNKSGKSGALFTVSPEFVDDFQFICMRLGYSSYISKPPLRGNRTVQVYAINMVMRSEYRVKVVTAYSSVQNYTGKVFCFTVPSGLLVTQRNNKISVQGNCAKDIWLLHDMWDTLNPDIVKGIRQDTKGGWTFAQFYGSYWEPCARLLWEQRNTVLVEGLTLKEHMKRNGITRLGTVVKGVPSPGSFLEHVKKFEEKFWGVMFPGYAKWKEDIWASYLKKGYVETYLGFRYKGLMNDREACNYPIQGTSFHLMLHTLTRLSKEIKLRGMKTKLIGQIHDSIIADIPVNEVPEYLKLVTEIIQGLNSEFPWLVTPMSCDSELSDTYENGGNFAKMLEVDKTCIPGLEKYSDIVYAKGKTFN